MVRLARRRAVAVLGGEHTISSGVVRGLAGVCGTADLVAVQIDAHADLRDEYEGSPYSHACAARRILETCPLMQIGIRNISAEEERFRRGSDRVTTLFAEDSIEGPEALERLAAFVRGKQVFLTIDLDGLDPSIMPSVGTPEPGGLSWARTLELVGTLCRHAVRVPVFDVVELAPIPRAAGPRFPRRQARLQGHDAGAGRAIGGVSPASFPGNHGEVTMGAMPTPHAWGM